MRSGLLKRFESSVYGFGKTVARMIAHHEAFLEALARDKVVRKEFFRELSVAGENGGARIDHRSAVGIRLRAVENQTA